MIEFRIRSQSSDLTGLEVRRNLNSDFSLTTSGNEGDLGSLTSTQESTKSLDDTIGESPFLRGAWVRQTFCNVNLAFPKTKFNPSHLCACRSASGHRWAWKQDQKSISTSNLILKSAFSSPSYMLFVTHVNVPYLNAG